MSTDVSGALPLNEADGPAESEESRPDQEATSAQDSRRETQWKVVTKTAGLAPAQMMAQWLQAKGIPARAWQEGAGRALGLTVGLLGTGYVIVPESQLDRAKALVIELETAESPIEDDEDE